MAQRSENEKVAISCFLSLQLGAHLKIKNMTNLILPWIDPMDIQQDIMTLTYSSIG